MSTICPICNNEVEDDASKCPFCGYHISGSTESFTPVKLGPDGALAGEELDQRFDFRVVRGPQTGVTISLHEGVLSVGRDPKCDIFLNDMTVSRKHAQIDVSKKGCIIRDMKSFNGVWVNDRMEDTCLLQTGDIVQIGAFCLVYRERP
ncbi:MAG TPA: FHA domain-containing protein [Eggerthellaceae bacterium]|nr:FHA domain-containing protein [Eggerthellaceae bacterium]